ncbi:MAG: hypothetical protein C5B49_15815 [Bdellovibrio sp.]|nr:MAG: hypothetical protein C5B49_15815 [Bdellovibrio sp.]
MKLAWKLGRNLSVSFFFVSAIAPQVSAEAVVAESAEREPAYYKVKSVEVAKAIELLDPRSEIPKNLGEGVCRETKPARPQGGVGLDDIVNVGKLIWDAIVDDTPTVDFEINVGTAIPSAVKCWTDLQDFQEPQLRSKTVSLTNFLGMTAVQFDYLVIWLPGGKYKEQRKYKGKYIGYATIIPKNIYLIHGWHVEARVSVVAFNKGTRNSPLAGMILNIVYRMSNLFSLTEKGDSFEIDATGGFKGLQDAALSGPVLFSSAWHF